MSEKATKPSDQHDASHHHKKSGGGMKFLSILFWPITLCTRGFSKHFLAYLVGYTLRDKRRIYSIKFIWYGDSVYLHPMVWGSWILHGLSYYNLVSGGWLLLIWFVLLVLCYLAVMYNFNVIKAATLLVGVVAFFGVAYFSKTEWGFNPLYYIGEHIRGLGAEASPGFYAAAAYVFLLLICAQVVWAWLFHRVELDESYVYEHRFLQGTNREPIFARGLKRETKDLLELLLLGAADIQHRTRSGSKRFKNVPFASLWLGRSIDSLLDYRRMAEVDLEASRDVAAEEARVSDAIHDDDGGFDDHGDDGHGDDGHGDDGHGDDDHDAS